MQSTVWEHRVLLFFIACHSILLWRLWSQKLTGVYLFLTAFLAAEMLQSIILFPFSRETNTYAILFEFSTAVIWVLADNPARFFYERMGGKRAGERDERLWGALLHEIGYGWSEL